MPSPLPLAFRQPVHPWRRTGRTNSKGASKGDGGIPKGKGKGKERSNERGAKGDTASEAAPRLDDPFAALRDKASSAKGDAKAALEQQLTELEAAFQELEAKSSTKDLEPTSAAHPPGHKERWNRELAPL